VFRNTDLKLAFETNNTIKLHVRRKGRASDVYNLCKVCPLKCVGQTGRRFRIRYNEHIRDIQTIDKSSKFAQDIIGTMHNYDTMGKTMKILDVEK
jgi:hypothetical protein